MLRAGLIPQSGALVLLGGGVSGQLYPTAPPVSASDPALACAGLPLCCVLTLTHIFHGPTLIFSQLSMFYLKPLYQMAWRP